MSYSYTDLEPVLSFHSARAVSLRAPLNSLGEEPVVPMQSVPISVSPGFPFPHSGEETDVP